MFIYRIFSKHTTQSYIGSTKQKYLSDRISCHRVQYRRWVKGDKLYCSSFEILKLGLDDIEYECLETTDDCKRECYWISQYDCVNINSLKFGKKGCPIKRKQYAIDNSDRLKEYQKEYKKKNKDKIYSRQNEKIPCDICSKLISKTNLKRHKREVHKITN